MRLLIYTVRSGDSIYSIAHRYGVSVQAITNDNQLQNPNQLVVGQALVIPVDATVHRVVAGESIYQIARNYGTTVAQILAVNPDITNPSSIHVGQNIVIPKQVGTSRKIDVNGYSFPSTNAGVIQNTLPYLTYLSIFAYQARADGSLVTIPDTPQITTAWRNNVAPMMVLTNILEGGSFNSDLAHTILTDEQVRNTLLDNVVATLNEKDYFGLDIDFEYIYPNDRQSYNDFLRMTVDRLHPLGYQVVTSLAPKTSASQTGLLYTAHDYPVHGRLADHVILMTYEWGYTYGPAQAVAPIDQVEKVLQYAVSVIPSQKILMGMPNYGYDWTLPFVQGSAARSITNREAVNLAAREGAQIKYDMKAQAPYFNYYDSSGREHEVWFDDARSIQARLRLVEKYNLGGVSYWTIGSYFRPNWVVLDSMYDINKVV